MLIRHSLFWKLAEHECATKCFNMHKFKEKNVYIKMKFAQTWTWEYLFFLYFNFNYLLAPNKFFFLRCKYFTCICLLEWKSLFLSKPVESELGFKLVWESIRCRNVHKMLGRRNIRQVVDLWKNESLSFLLGGLKWLKNVNNIWFT